MLLALMLQQAACPPFSLNTPRSTTSRIISVFHSRAELLAANTPRSTTSRIISVFHSRAELLAAKPSSPRALGALVNYMACRVQQYSTYKRFWVFVLIERYGGRGYRAPGV